MAAHFEPGQRVRLPRSRAEWVTVDCAIADGSGGWNLYVAVNGEDVFHKVVLSAEEASQIEVLARDGDGSPAGALAGIWTCWMSAALCGSPRAALPLRPYAHQVNAVYGTMLPQPRLRFLLADEPGTGKTIMAGLYLHEMRRLGLVNRVIIVAPAGLVSKWQADYERFFGGGLRRITAETIHEDALNPGHNLWVVSLELAAVNAGVQEAIRPDRAGWDAVVFDEAHRLTPTAPSLHRVGRLLANGSPHALFMTATPHRGSEWLFRHLLHLVDPEVYPDPGGDARQALPAVRPGSVHFLRRMKEGLVEHDGVTPLFKKRHATNYRIPLNDIELDLYTRALDLVDRFFVLQARALARMVYGKRAASSLYALVETLRRRLEHMGALSAAEAAAQADPEGEDEATRDEARVVYADSTAPLTEKTVLSQLITEVTEWLQTPAYLPSKWRELVDRCLMANGIRPGTSSQAVIFSEYFDSATWIADRLARDGYSTRVYSGRQTHKERDQIRSEFASGEFQIIVSTDAGNEGIDLQIAHVLINYDIPWSLVRLEQRMGRIHRVGQTRDVELYSLIATNTREGDTLHTLLENFVTAANELDGQMFDSLSLIAELASVRYEEWLRVLYGDDEMAKAQVLSAARQVNAAALKRQAKSTHDQNAELATEVDTVTAMVAEQWNEPQRTDPPLVVDYLGRLADAGVINVRPTAAGDDALLISAESLPKAFGETRQALVAIGPDTVASVRSRAISLLPGTPALAELNAAAEQALEPDRYRGATVVDPNTAVGYQLFAFTARIASRKVPTGPAWSALIRVDLTGESRQVDWQILANLAIDETRLPPHVSSQEHLAIAEAGRVLAHAVSQRESAWRAWFANARRDLSNLPIDMSRGISDRGERITLRDRLATATTRRLALMEQFQQAEPKPPRLLAWLQVVPPTISATRSRREQEAQ